jgi:hypothetical protein
MWQGELSAAIQQCRQGTRAGDPAGTIRAIGAAADVGPAARERRARPRASAARSDVALFDIWASTCARDRNQHTVVVYNNDHDVHDHRSRAGGPRLCHRRNEDA